MAKNDVNYIILMKIYHRNMMTEMKKMPFLIVKRTLSCMYFKFMREFRNFHFVKIIKFTRITCHENHAKIIKLITYLCCKKNEKNAISDCETDTFMHEFRNFHFVKIIKFT
jgi:hypothetical protein